MQGSAMSSSTESSTESPAASPVASELTELLVAWSRGNASALDHLMPLVYDELRQLARSYLRRERSDHTLQPTAVTHEAYLRLVERTHPNWHGRLHFFAVAAQAMRRVLVDHARGRRADKRGGKALRVPLDDYPEAAVEEAPDYDLIDLDTALERLTQYDARKSRVIELRYFGGLTARETAEVLDVSVETVQLDTRFAHSWLNRQLAHPVDGAAKR